MQILHKKDGNKGFFHIGDENNTLAKMTYSMAGAEKMIIDHTEVSEELRGKNAGYQLVSAAVEYARENAIRIIPLCPFANSVFKKKSEVGDVLFTH